MVRLAKSKRGISPLIATVLLIAFSVALGTMIMNWSHDVLNPPGDDYSCDAINVGIRLSEGMPIICILRDISTIKVVLENQGEMPFDFIDYSVIDTNTPDLFDGRITEGIEVGRLTNEEISYTLQDDSSLQISFVPGFKTSEGERICTEKKIVYDNIPQCVT